MKKTVEFGWRAAVATGALAAASLAMTGCRIDEHKSGDHHDVKIATPFGGMSVKTDQAAVQSNVGIAVYPGATLVRDHTSEDGNHDNGSADINLNFAGFHLGVRALSYATPDAPEKVIAFYRKDLGRYGQVIFCKDHEAVGSPSETQDGLTCEKHGKTSIKVDEDGSAGELKAGSKLHQHIVAIDPQGSGTKFGLVALDLPGHLGTDDSDKSE